MEHETVPFSLALFDFVPNIAFLVGAYFLVKITVLLRSSACSRMVMAGSLLIALGGILKATWKLIYAAGVADIRWMSEVQFALVAPGFLGLLIAVILVARSRRKQLTLPILAIAPWKIPLLILMTLASLGAQGILSYIAFRKKARLAAAGFIVAFLCLLAMGNLASGEQTLARQWLEEGINSIGQVGFMLGSLLLYRNVKQSGGEC